jgi:hypothetical protein
MLSWGRILTVYVVIVPVLECAHFACYHVRQGLRKLNNQPEPVEEGTEGGSSSAETAANILDPSAEGALLALGEGEGESEVVLTEEELAGLQEGESGKLLSLQFSSRWYY